MMGFEAISPASLAIIFFAVAVGAFAKGITGLGLPLFAIPMLALFTTVEEAVVLMVLPSVVGNLWLNVVHRRWFPILKTYWIFLLLGFFGALFGTWLLTEVSDRGLKALLAVWLGLYLVQKFSRTVPAALFAGEGKLGGPLGFAAGTIQGATGISAPIVAPYYHARGLSQASYAFAVSFTFALFSIAQITAIVATDLITPARLVGSLLAVVPTVLFVPVGVRFAAAISHRAFERILLVLFVLMEFKLIVDVVR